MTHCKGCGRKIIWGITPSGKRIPLDPKPPVYLLKGNPTKNGNLIAIERMRQVHVSHFATCPRASDFSSNQSTKKEDPNVN